MDITETFGFDAPPEVVYNTLTDPDRANRWLPFEVRAERLDRGLRLALPGTGQVFDVDTDAGTLALRWRSPDDDGLAARAHVDDGPAGGSEVHVSLSVPASVADEARVRSVLSATMRHLSRDVGDNLTAG